MLARASSLSIRRVGASSDLFGYQPLEQRGEYFGCWCGWQAWRGSELSGRRVARKDATSRQALWSLPS